MIDPSAVFTEGFASLDGEGTRLWEFYLDIIGHACGACGQDNDSRSEEYRFRYSMGDEDNRLATSLPNIEEFEIHLFSGECVESAERLVHQYELRIVN